MSMFVVELPTGSPETDTNIVVAACRSGCADLCAVYATSTDDVALALNVAARTGVETDLCAAVGDRCIQAFGGGDAELALAALRCLLAMGDFKRVPVSALRPFVASEDRRLRACACVAIAALAMQRVPLPVDLFVQLARCGDPRASWPVVAGCRDEAVAAALLGVWEEETPAPSEAALKAIAAAGWHVSLRGRCRAVIERIGFGKGVEFQSELSELEAKLAVQN
jgi:hypothetical protein